MRDSKLNRGNFISSYFNHRTHKHNYELVIYYIIICCDRTRIAQYENFIGIMHAVDYFILAVRQTEAFEWQTFC